MDSGVDGVQHPVIVGVCGLALMGAGVGGSQVCLCRPACMPNSTHRTAAMLPPHLPSLPRSTRRLQPRSALRSSSGSLTKTAVGRGGSSSTTCSRSRSSD